MWRCPLCWSNSYTSYHSTLDGKPTPHMSDTFLNLISSLNILTNSSYALNTLFLIFQYLSLPVGTTTTLQCLISPSVGITTLLRDLKRKQGCCTTPLQKAPLSLLCYALNSVRSVASAARLVHISTDGRAEPDSISNRLS